MDRNEFSALLHNVQKTLFWSDYITFNPLTKELISRQQRFKFLTETELSEAIKQLKDFDINQLWDKKFWGLKQHESICAVATEAYQSVLRIKAAY